MVLKKRLDYGFNGFQVPFIPRAPRSARRKSLFTKPAGHGQACAFELLASLAGKLLQESENSSASSNVSEGNHHPSSSMDVVEQERQYEVKPLAKEDINQGACAVSIYMAEMASRITHKKCLVQIENDAVQVQTSVYNSDCWEKVEVDVEAEICKGGNKFGHDSCRLVETHQDFRDSCGGNVNRFRQEQGAGSSDIEGSPLVNKCSLKHPLELCINPTALIDSNVNVRSPFCGGPSPNASFSRHGNNIKLDFRDDDENFFRCNKVSTKSKPYRPPKIVHQRIRRLLTSKYWKPSPKLKDCELSRSDQGVKLRDLKRKTYCSLDRYQHSTLFKRKKFFGQGPVVTSNRGFSCESVSNSPEKAMDGDNHSTFTNSHASKDTHVKVSIKSFRIPELYIEVPETATIGSLKRTVMEAVMAILGGGVSVGVLLQGKKVRDDNRTLVQTGISCKENLDSLGFTLEPNSLEAPSDVCVGDLETSPGIRSSGTPISDSRVIDALRDSFLLTNMGNIVKTNQGASSSPTDVVADKVIPTSLALFPIPARSTEPLAVLPVSQKTRRSELVQRRTRRPFSVSEVEALVQAVEELGTGRWRDVKLCAFENADHRTYVDLKDKWKTLVHTARISPQQRRGEPVPQRLLDRVLAAHAFWSQQHGKPHQPATMKSTEASAETHGTGIQPL